MILKIIACVAAAIPLFLFIRAVFLPGNDADQRRLKEIKKQANLAVSNPHIGAKQTGRRPGGRIGPMDELVSMQSLSNINVWRPLLAPMAGAALTTAPDVAHLVWRAAACDRR
jgi:hypothetical protein